MNRPRVLVRFDNGEFTGSKKKAILLVAIALLVGVLLSDQLMKTYSVPVGSSSVIWRDNFANADLGNYNCRLASFTAGWTPAGTGAQGMKLDANSTGTAVCITKNKIDVSLAVSKTLFFESPWYLNTTLGNYPDRFGMFFTNNGTVPTQILDYNPLSDTNVLLSKEQRDNGGGQFFSILFSQRTEGHTLSEDDPGSCGKGGSIFICGNVASWPTIGSYVSSSFSANAAYLNYTGNAGSVGASSEVVDGPPAAIETTNTDNPWFQIAGSSYYLGFYERPRTGSVDPISLVFYAPTVDTIVPIVSVPGIPRQFYDTGGFFGPVIRALINIGILVFRNVIVFFGFIGSVVVTALNTVGSFFGLGPLGTDMQNFFAGIASFFTNVFGPIIGSVANVIATIAALITAGLTLTTSYFSNIASFFSSLASFLTGFWTVYGQFVKFGASSMFSLWMIYGIFTFLGSLERGMGWFKTTGDIGLMIVRGLQWGGEEGVKALVRIKKLVAQWL